MIINILTYKYSKKGNESEDIYLANSPANRVREPKAAIFPIPSYL